MTIGSYRMIAALALAVLQPAASFALDPPPIPVGAWYKSSRTEPDYVRAVALSLKEHSFNTVVGNASFTREMVDIFAQQGIAVITRGDKFLDHPAVIGSIVGGEPAPGKPPGRDVEQLKEQYETLRGQTAKPLLTCVVGDGLGVDAIDDPWKVWKGVKPKVRCLSWYGIARGHYGILHKRLYKGYVSFPSVLRQAGSGKRAYWIVLPSFGKNDIEADHQNPSPAQMRGMMHLAVAYGARGILFWALQDHGDWQCLVAEDSLKPTDEKYAAAAAVAAKINAHAALLASLRPAGGDIRCPSPYVDAIGQRSKSNHAYLYVVNRNTKQPVSTTLLSWGAKPKPEGVRDIFSGQAVAVSAKLDKEGYWRMPITLRPGEGKLLDFGPGKAKPAPERDAPPDDAAAGGGAPPERPRETPGARKQGAARARKLLEPWLARSTNWDDPLLGGKLLIDGKNVYQGGGKLIGAYENKSGALATWEVAGNLGQPSPARSAFVTFGAAAEPRPLALLMLDLTPEDGKEHTYELHLPMAGRLAAVRSLTADVSLKALAAARGNANAANKLNMRNYKYFQVYPRGRANYCADTVLRPAAKNAPGWLIARIIEPRSGPVFPAAYRAKAGETAGSLVVSGRGKELRLKLFLFVDPAPATEEPLIYTAWTGQTELRLGTNSFLELRRVAYGRTVFTLSGPAFKIAVSDEGQAMEDDMMKAEGGEALE